MSLLNSVLFTLHTAFISSLPKNTGTFEHRPLSDADIMLIISVLILAGLAATVIILAFNRFWLKRI